MPYFYEIVPAVDIIFIRHIGIVSTEDVCCQFREIMRQRDFKPGMSLLFDHREEVPPDFGQRLENHPRQNDEMYQIRLKEMFNLLEGVKMACIIDKKLVGYFESMISAAKNIDAIESNVFFDVEQAKDWLGIPTTFETEGTLRNIIYAGGCSSSNPI